MARRPMASDITCAKSLRTTKLFGNVGKKAGSALKNDKTRKSQANPSHELIQQKSNPRNCEQ